mmetsp:Transcript_29972/g.47826  ORF Transcript_29972/g.47826 Transcript_29972/m.47826 type:complete len:209 (+) Transcript_29972:921-1547(+)
MKRVQRHLRGRLADRLSSNGSHTLTGINDGGFKSSANLTNHKHKGRVRHFVFAAHAFRCHLRANQTLDQQRGIDIRLVIYIGFFWQHTNGVAQFVHFADYVDWIQLTVHFAARFGQSRRTSHLQRRCFITANTACSLRVHFVFDTKLFLSVPDQSLDIYRQVDTGRVANSLKDILSEPLSVFAELFQLRTQDNLRFVVRPNGFLHQRI